MSHEGKECRKKDVRKNTEIIEIKETKKIALSRLPSLTAPPPESGGGQFQLIFFWREGKIFFSLPHDRILAKMVKQK